MNDLPSRKSIRLQGYDYSQAGCYFITICVKDKLALLGQIVGATVPGRPHVRLSGLGKIVDSAIRYYVTNETIIIDKYVIMPNHIHLMIIIRPETGDRGRSPLQYIVRSLKAYVTKNAGYSPWQKSFYDHIVRDEAEYLLIWQYIDENPQRWSEDCFYTR